MKSFSHTLFFSRARFILCQIFLTSCTHISRPSITQIEINSNVSAICKFTDSWGVRLINTPGTVHADPKHGPAKLECKSNGYNDFIETEIGDIKDKNQYPTMISATMLPEKSPPTVSPELRQTKEINQGKSKLITPKQPEDNAAELSRNTSEQTTASPDNINHQMLKMNPSHYTLSLFSMKSKNNAIQAIDRYKIKEQAVLSSYHKKGHQWYAVSYGDYTTVNLAKDALATLPERFQKLKPWIRSFKSIHRDIRTSNPR
jgi:septal ring-binding cell division protein DamX